MPRSHDRTHFYKYFSADGVEATLANSSLRWRSPNLFNDPFDHQTTFVFHFGSEDVFNELRRAQERLIAGPAEPVFERQRALGQALLVARKALAGKDPKPLLDKLVSGAREVADDLPNYIQKFNGELITQLNHSRVLCVTESHTNIVMWSHYAEEHRGAVLRFECLDAIDDNLLAARQVRYTNDFPSFVSVQQWVAHLTGESPIDFGALFLETAYVKHTDWTYEREWRVYLPLLGEPAGDGVSFYKKDPKVFTEIYFGCRMPDEQQQRLLELIEAQYPWMRAYKTKRAPTSFALEFEQVR